MLRLEQVETFYGETQALFGVSLEVGRGEVVALLGPNGAGKTTLLRSVLGLTPARRGRIEFAGRDITRAPTHEIARAGIGWVPDDRRVFPTPDGGAQPGDRAQEDALSRLEREGLLRHLQRPGVPDGARVREPLGRRDADGRDLARLARRARPGAVRRAEPGAGAEDRAGRDEDDPAPAATRASACCVVEQNVQSALAVADRVYVLDRGRIVHEGGAGALLDDGARRTELLGV